MPQYRVNIHTIKEKIIMPMKEQGSIDPAWLLAISIHRTFLKYGAEMINIACEAITQTNFIYAAAQMFSITLEEAEICWIIIQHKYYT
jgi:imidazole glycerol phosphate synthase subunit HisF